MATVNVHATTRPFQTEDDALLLSTLREQLGWPAPSMAAPPASSNGRPAPRLARGSFSEAHRRTLNPGCALRLLTRAPAPLARKVCRLQKSARSIGGRDMLMNEPFDEGSWIACCVARMVELDPMLDPELARPVAEEMSARTRWRVMAPEDAAQAVFDFVQKPSL